MRMLNPYIRSKGLSIVTANGDAADSSIPLFSRDVFCSNRSNHVVDLLMSLYTTLERRRIELLTKGGELDVMQKRDAKASYRQQMQVEVRGGSSSY